MQCLPKLSHVKKFNPEKFNPESVQFFSVVFWCLGQFGKERTLY